jgi:cardiolipin synthase
MDDTRHFDTPPHRASRVLSLPNMLTYGRIAAVPAIVLSFYLEGFVGRWLAVLIFIAASVTDFFDGYLARVWKQQSALGRMLDPIADKLLVSTCLLLLASNSTIGGWSLLAAIVILTREISVSGLREFLAELRVSVPVTRLAKWKTTMQMIAIGFLLAGPAGDRIFPYTTYVGLLLLWISALVTLYTGYDYFRAGLQHLISEDE